MRVCGRGHGSEACGGRFAGAPGGAGSGESGNDRYFWGDRKRSGVEGGED